jgi:hypothetical protein
MPNAMPKQSKICASALACRQRSRGLPSPSFLPFACSLRHPHQPATHYSTVQSSLSLPLMTNNDHSVITYRSREWPEGGGSSIYFFPFILTCLRVVDQVMARWRTWGTGGACWYVALYCSRPAAALGSSLALSVACLSVYLSFSLVSPVYPPASQRVSQSAVSGIQLSVKLILALRYNGHTKSVAWGMRGWSME